MFTVENGSGGYDGFWNSCKVELPGSQRKVLVWRQSPWRAVGVGGGVTISVCRMTKQGPQWDCDQSYFPVPPSVLRRVTHWMELPLPPGEGGETESPPAAP